MRKRPSNDPNDPSRSTPPNRRGSWQRLPSYAPMREFARTVTDPEVLSEVYAMIEEWERRARLQDNGDASG